MELGVDEYKSLTPLSVRQAIHRKYSNPPDHLEETTLTAAALSPDDSVADIGPGNGSFLRRLIQSGGHRGPIIALDRSMAASRAVSDIGGPYALQGDACRLPFIDTIFDVLFARHMLYHVSDVTATLREFHRVLRRGGKFVAVVNHADQAPRLSALLRHRVQANGVDPPELPQVNSTTLPNLLRRVFGNFSVTRFDGHLVFPDPAPVVALGTALLSFYGVNPGSPLRANIEAQLVDDIHRWFAQSEEPWHDPKGYAVFVSIRRD